MNEEILYIDDGELVYYINEKEFITCDEIPHPMLEGIKHLQQKVEQLEKENKILKENAEHNDKVVDKVNWENMLLKRKNKEIERLIINHNCDTGDIYYKYNGKYLKSELKERIMELVELKEYE